MPDPKVKLWDSVHEVARYRQFSPRTEKPDWGWIERRTFNIELGPRRRGVAFLRALCVVALLRRGAIRGFLRPPQKLDLNQPNPGPVISEKRP